MTNAEIEGSPGPVLLRLAVAEGALVTRAAPAAQLSGATINQFVVQAALEKAERVIDRERATVLIERDARRFLELLEHPRAPNERLGRALAAHREATRGRPGRPFSWPARPRGV